MSAREEVRPSAVQVAVAVAAAACETLLVEGTDVSDDRYGYAFARGAPWFVIDITTAEPEVNWPGELVAGPFDTYREAHTALAREIALRILNACNR